MYIVKLLTRAIQVKLRNTARLASVILNYTSPRTVLRNGKLYLAVRFDTNGTKHSVAILTFIFNIMSYYKIPFAGLAVGDAAYGLEYEIDDV